MKGKILCPAGCQNPVSRITKAKENLKNLRPAGSWRPFKCIFGERQKTAHSGLQAPPRSLYVRKNPDRGSLRLTESKFLPRCQNPQFCGFCPSRETCWGVPSPNPALRLAPLIPAALMRQERRSRPCERNTTHPTAAAL